MNNQRTFTRPEVNNKGIEKVPYYYHYSISELREKLGIEQPKQKIEQKKYSRAMLNEIARNSGMKCYPKMSKYELAKKLEKFRKRRASLKPRIPRSVLIFNKDGTTTIFSSISKASKALGKHSWQIYTMVANGKAIID